mmetsp:Transcript_16167/g.61243  ORF Transcript_16167/g.61243 Transcript_16167/m.61243 type:complete len:292 (+) Transcript_16167:946-1821(+)
MDSSSSSGHTYCTHMYPPAPPLAHDESCPDAPPAPQRWMRTVRPWPDRRSARNRATVGVFARWARVLKPNVSSCTISLGVSTPQGLTCFARSCTDSRGKRRCGTMSGSSAARTASPCSLVSAGVRWARERPAPAADAAAAADPAAVAAASSPASSSSGGDPSGLGGGSAALGVGVPALRAAHWKHARTMSSSGAANSPWETRAASDSAVRKGRLGDLMASLGSESAASTAAAISAVSFSSAAACITPTASLALRSSSMLRCSSASSAFISSSLATRRRRSTSVALPPQLSV